MRLDRVSPKPPPIGKGMEDLRLQLLNKTTSRLAIAESGEIDIEKREVCLTYSSETPVLRWFGWEILSHDGSAQNTKRINRGGSLLLNHDIDKHIGVVKEADIVNGRGKAIVKFSRKQSAEEAFQDVQDGTMPNVSFRYRYEDMDLIESGEDREDGIDVWRVTKYEVMEISLVSVPADIEVGVGRGFHDVNEDEESRQAIFNIIQQKKGGQMSTANQQKPAIQGGTSEGTGVVTVIQDVGRSEIIEIMELGQQFSEQDLAKKFIATGKGADEFRKEVLKKMGAKTLDIIPAVSYDIGLTKKQTRGYDFIGVVNAMASGDFRGIDEQREISNAIAKKIGREPNGIFIPTDALRRIQVGDQTLPEGNLSTGASLVEDELRPESFISLLRNRLIIRTLGAQMLDNLKGSVSIPRQTGGATAYWVAEGAPPPKDSNQTTDQVGLSPKSVGAFTDISRKLLLQSSISVQNFVIDDIAAVIAREIDRIAIFGTGLDSQPKGIIAQTGVSTIGLGTNGGPITFQRLVEMETEVSSANADQGTLAYLMNAKMRGHMKTKLKTDGIPGFLWESDNGKGEGIVNGYRAAVTNMIPSNLSKGNKNNLTAIVFGAFNDLIIGSWGVLDMQVNPYGPGSEAGTVRIRALQDVDVAVRHPESFSVALDVAI